jgi:hypothetical protein
VGRADARSCSEEGHDIIGVNACRAATVMVNVTAVAIWVLQ